MLLHRRKREMIRCLRRFCPPCIDSSSTSSSHHLALTHSILAETYSEAKKGWDSVDALSPLPSPTNTRKFEQLFSPGPRLISGDEDDSSSITSRSSTYSLPADASVEFGPRVHHAIRRPPGFDRRNSVEILHLSPQRHSAPPIRREPSYNSYHHQSHQPSSYTVGVPADKVHYPSPGQGIPIYNQDARLPVSSGSSHAHHQKQFTQPRHKSSAPGAYHNITPHYPMGLTGPPQAAYTQSSSSSQNSRGSQQSQVDREGPNSVSSVSSSNASSNASNRSAARAPQGSDQFIKFVTRVRLIDDYEEAIKYCKDNKYLFEAESSKVSSGQQHDISSCPIIDIRRDG